MIWDRILDQDTDARVVETWGGISYSLEALSVALPPGWVAVPLMKTGADRAEAARTYLSTLPALELGSGLRTVASPATRVELRYRGGIRRAERLTGPMPPWTWEELEGELEGFDAVYINFITGFEMGLEVATLLRDRLAIPTYADLHSLFLDISPQGHRSPRSLAQWRRWLQAFDAVQMNEGEFRSLARPGEDPWALARPMVGGALKLLIVTLGPLGVAYLASPGLGSHPGSWRREDQLHPGAERPVKARVRGGDVPRSGDPTGCGDVWGATFFARLLAGESLERAMIRANAFASRKLEHVGAPGLRFCLGRDEGSGSSEDEAWGAVAPS